MLCSIETSSSGAVGGHRSGTRPEPAVHDPLVRFQAIAIGDHVLAAERAAAADVLIGVEIDVAAAHAGDPRAQHRDQRRHLRAAVEERAKRIDLILLDVDQEHVGAVALRRDREVGEQIGLERADAEHEEAAQADRQHDHARLIAGTAKADDGVAEREPAGHAPAAAPRGPARARPGAAPSRRPRSRSTPPRRPGAKRPATPPPRSAPP